jgi:hypothetical protein
VDTVIRIVAAVVGIGSTAVSIVMPGNTLAVVQAQQYRAIKDYHIEHRNLHLDYSECHNWDIQVPQALTVFLEWS